MKVIRLDWLDIAKGLAIILMVVGHSSLPSFIDDFIWSFHMPLFFIASGWVTNWGKNTFCGFALHKAWTLLLPFIIYSSVVLLFAHLLNMKGENFNPINWLTTGWGGYALWFIPVLFLSSVLAKGLYSIDNIYLRYSLFVATLVIGCVLSYNKLYLPWTISTVPYATFLIATGTELKRYTKYIESTKWYYILILFVITATISHFWRLDMCYNCILPIVPLTIGAISGTLMLFMISALIDSRTSYLKTLLTSIGKETFIVVAFSQLIILTFNQHITHNAPIKYGALIIILIIIKYLKDGVNRLCKTKIL